MVYNNSVVLFQPNAHQQQPKEATMSNNTTVRITESQVPSILENNVKGAEIFHISFVKANGETREANAQLHVQHPRNTDLTPNGRGESAVDAMKDGRVKFYEPHHAGLNGEGVYRQCRISRINSMKIKNITYIVIH